MEEPANGSIRRQPVIERDRGSGFLDVYRDARIPQQFQRLRTGLQPAELASAEDDDPATVIQKLHHIGRLDPRHVMRVSLVPVPTAAAAWPELEVAARPEAFDFHPSPVQLQDSR